MIANTIQRKCGRFRLPPILFRALIVATLGLVGPRGTATEPVSPEKIEVLRGERTNSSHSVPSAGLRNTLARLSRLAADSDPMASLRGRVMYIRNNMGKNDQSIEPPLNYLFVMLKPVEALAAAPEIVDLLVEVASTHDLPSVRLAALMDIAYLRTPTAVPGLTAMLSAERDARVRLFVAIALLAAGDAKSALPPLAVFATKRDAELWQFDTANWFSDLRAGSMAEEAIQTWREEAMPSMALDALAGVRSEEARNAIGTALTDSNPYVKFAAARALIVQGEPAKALPVVAAFARDGTVRTPERVQAIALLQRSQDRRVVSATLASLTEDVNESVRQQAQKALRNLAQIARVALLRPARDD